MRTWKLHSCGLSHSGGPDSENCPPFPGVTSQGQSLLGSHGLLPHSPRTHSSASVARVAHSAFLGVEVCFPLHSLVDKRQRIIIFKRNIIRPFLRVTFVFSKRSMNILLSLDTWGLCG